MYVIEHAGWNMDVLKATLLTKTCHDVYAGVWSATTNAHCANTRPTGYRWSMCLNAISC